MKSLRSAALCLFLFLLTSALVGARPASEPLTPQNRLAIVRTLDYEYATARQPMPASKGTKEALRVTAAGQVDQEKLRRDLAQRGAAVYTGEIIQITGIRFLRDSILFEINGGGKKKRPWWKGVQVGVGGPVSGPTVEKTPEGAPSEPGVEPQRSGNGSWVLLAFSEAVPDLTPEQVKQLLAGVLDFSRRSATVPWIETIPVEFREAIKDKRAVKGMSHEMVLASMGRPERKVRETREGKEYEDWIYGNPPFVTFVTFVEDEVVEVKEFR